MALIAWEFIIVVLIAVTAVILMLVLLGIYIKEYRYEKRRRYLSEKRDRDLYNYYHQHDRDEQDDQHNQHNQGNRDIQHDQDDQHDQHDQDDDKHDSPARVDERAHKERILQIQKSQLTKEYDNEKVDNIRRKERT